VIENKCPHYPVFYYAFTCNLPLPLIPQCINKEISIPNYEGSIAMVIVQEKLQGYTLNELNDHLTTDEVLTITIQILYALYAAQLEYGFKHSDFGPKNILVIPITQEENLIYTFGTLTVSVRTHYMVKIIDFANAVIYDPELDFYLNAEILTLFLYNIYVLINLSLPQASKFLTNLDLDRAVDYSQLFIKNTPINIHLPLYQLSTHELILAYQSIFNLAGRGIEYCVNLLYDRGFYQNSDNDNIINKPKRRFFII